MAPKTDEDDVGEEGGGKKGESTFAEEGEADEENETRQRKKKKKKKGATLDANSISKLLEMVRNEKVWESLFSPSVSGGQDVKKKSRLALSGRGRGRMEGGTTWTPLTRRQRCYLELQARLVRILQRLHLAEAEDKGNGAADSLELLIEQAQERMWRSGIEQGEIDIVPKDGSTNAATSDGNKNGGHVVPLVALAHSPWIRMAGRHLHKLNPKLGRVVSLLRSPANASISQDGSVRFSLGGSQASQIDLSGSFSEEALRGKAEDDGTLSCKRLLLESCPMLRALTIDENTLVSTESDAATAASMTQGTMMSSFTAPTPTKTNQNVNNPALDSLRPTTVTTLQFLAACIDAFPRGE